MKTLLVAGGFVLLAGFHQPASFDASASEGGGHRMYFDGSPRQKGYDCTACHTDPARQIAAKIDIVPAAAGALASDSGLTSTKCALPSPPPAGTTALDGDCKVIFAMGAYDLDTWTFTWTAPASDTVRVYWGAVDGNCDMMSMRDAAITGSMTLASPPMAQVDGRGALWPMPLFASVGLIGLAAAPRRRRSG